MTMIHALRAGLVGIALLGAATAARADALDDIMKAKVIKVAVPQDFAPFGSAGLDLKPQGYDIDMGNLIAKALGVKAGGTTSDRQFHLVEEECIAACANAPCAVVGTKYVLDITPGQVPAIIEDLRRTPHPETEVV